MPELPPNLVIVDLNEAPIAPDNWPTWTNEMERKIFPVLSQHTGKNFRDNVTIRFPLRGVPTFGTAVFRIMEGNPRHWQMRVTILPVNDNQHAARLYFHFPGEDPLDASGRPRMYPRLPFTKEYHGVCRSHSEVQEVIANCASRVDEEAEAIYQQAVSGNAAFQDALLDNPEKAIAELTATMVPKAEHEQELRWAKQFERTHNGDRCTPQALDVLRRAEAKGYTLSVRSDKTIVLSTEGSKRYLYSNLDILRFGRYL